MKNRILIFILTCWLIISCSPKPANLVIATAANVQFAMSELTVQFTDKTGIPCDIILGSSGKLNAQIKAGAPFDIFVAADIKYPDDLYRAGLTTGPPEIYAYGRLVLWTLNNDIIPSMEILNGDQVIHIAIANPETAPYGEAAVEALKKSGIYDHILPKLVYGESIAQVNQFILSKTAEIGFTAKSVVLSAELQNKGTWVEVDAGAYRPIAQGAVVIRHEDKNIKNAQKFYQFLFSEQGKEILIKSGYLADR